MLASGWTKLDRAWGASPESPFRDNRRHYLVWRLLAEQAAYMPMGAVGIGECSFSKNQLAELTCMSPSSVYRSVKWLAAQGLIKIKDATHRWVFQVVGYGLLDNMRTALDQIRKLANTVKNRVFSASENLSENCGPLTKTDTESQSPCNSTPLASDISHDNQCWTTDEKVGPVLDQSWTSGSSENHCEKPTLKNKVDRKVDQIRHVLSKNINKYINYNHSDKSNEEEDMAKTCSEFDMEMAKLWAEKMLEQDKANGRRGRKINIKQWAVIVRELREIDKFSEDEIRMMFKHRFEDSFYATKDIGIGNLRRTSGNGFSKAQNLLDAAKRELRKKEADKPITELPADFWQGAKVLDDGKTVRTASGALIRRSATPL